MLICLAQIDEVVTTIKSSASTAAASVALQSKFLLDEAQAKAVLDMKLSKLAHLEVKKLEDERTELQKESARIHSILENEELFNQELIKGWQEVAKKFGDERRTQILNLVSDGEDEIIEEKNLQLYLTNLNNFYGVETSSLFSQRRGGVGFKVKGLKKNEFIIGSASVKTNEKLLFFTKNGYYLNYKVNSLPLEQLTPLSSLIPIGDEIVCAVAAYKNQDFSITFITKKGLIKKSNFSEYNTSLAKPMKALNLDEGDEICSIVFEENEKKRLGILTSNGKFCIIDLQNVKAIGRLSRGVIGIKLDENSFVAAAHLIPPTASQIIAVSQKGYIKRTSIEEFATQGRGGKGAILQKLNSNDLSSDFFPLCSEKEIIINSNSSLIKIQITEIPEQSRNTIGVRSLKLNEGTNVISIN